MNKLKVSLLILFVFVFLSIFQCSISPQPNLVIKEENTTENFRFLIFTERCYNLLTQEHTLDFPCMKLSLSKLIGIAIVYLAIILKVPQILKITAAKSSEGLSYLGFYIELMTYTFSLGYNLHYKNPFSTYGENAFLIIQAIIILFLLKMYDSNLSAIKFWVSQIFYIVFCFVLFTDIVPEEVHQFSMIITIIFLYSSRAPQILLNLNNKSTGQLSFITVFLSFGGAVARTFTIFVEVKDILLLVLMVSASLLNGLLVLQFIMYWNRTPIAKKEKGKKE